MEDDKTYDVFHRTWWRKAEKSDGKWPNDRVPCCGEKHYLERGLSWADARALCQKWNAENDPGEMSDKAEFEEA